MLKPRPSRSLLPGPARAGAAAAPLLANDGEITVSALAGALKSTVEDRFGHVRVRGEVSNFRGVQASGHAYFSLKDEGARLDAVIWRTSYARLRIKPEEGMDVIATGRITTFPGKSSYQIVIEQLEPAGVGALMAALEERRQRLLAEGLFEVARKRPLPFLPHMIGVVTSPTGAVIRDIIHRIADRLGTRVVVWPVRVQGEGCAAEVTRAIEGFNRFGPPRPDVLIIARGGGSLEDLWGFNDEALVRAAAASGIPLVSAIGHETDWTLLDHVADLRAPTPTGAAELATPVRLDLATRIDRLEARQAAAVLRLLDDRRRSLRAAARLLPAAADLLAPARQRLAHAGERLPAALDTRLADGRLRAARLGGRLAAQAPRARLQRLDQQLDGLALRLRQARARAAADQGTRLQIAGDRLGLALAARLRLGRAALAEGRRRVEQAGARLAAAGADMEPRRAPLAALALRLGAAGDKVAAEGGARLGAAGDRLARALAARLRIGAAALVDHRRRLESVDARRRTASAMDAARRRARLDGLVQLLDSLSYRSVLARGFALVRDAAGEAVRRAEGLGRGTPLNLEFADGRIDVSVGAAAEPAARPPRGRASRPGDAPPTVRQGTLF